MPIRICEKCGEVKELIGEIRSPLCKSCASPVHRPYRNTKDPNRYKTITINGVTLTVHRYIMEQHLQRKLVRKEVVHHKDGNKHNNSIDNLELLTHSEHATLHIIERNMSEHLHVKASAARWGNK